ncbi:MAG: histidinol-phosphatase [Lentisphaerae bacterium]|nr:histidinol-phosphatase [Lentisphaerota bacterium]
MTTRRNFHTHTALCNHATGSVADYCEAAVAQGVTTLGISDHTPHPDGRWQSTRMAMAELPGYVQDIHDAAAAYPGLQVYAGIECEHVTEHLAFYQDELLGRHGLSYLIGAVHWYPYAGEWASLYGQPQMDAQRLHAYTDHIVELISSGYYAFIAHPDLFGVAYRGVDEELRACVRAIAQAAEACKVPLEINAYGLRKKKIEDGGSWRFMYPLMIFWEIVAEYQVPVIVNSDAHRPQDVWGNTDECLDIARRYSLHVVNDDFLVEKGLPVHNCGT